MSMPIKDIIDTEYKGYAMYVLENRAIPSAIDGLKPVHRKLLYSMLTDHKGKRTKLSDLSGISKHGYHHGESSAAGAAVTLSAPWNNNVPLFEADGNFGSRLIQEAAAPRYIYASLSKDFSKYFTDNEVAPANSDPENPEPQTYLPVIPWVLVNGIEGIAVGFACRFLPHNPKDLVKAVELSLAGKLNSDYKLLPSFPGFTGRVTQDTQTKYATIGTVTRTKRNTWVITEVPWGHDRESIYTLLSKMEDDKKIQDFSDGCDESGFRFEVKLDGSQDATAQKDPISYFKLERSVTENYTTLDETGKLKIFETKADLINYFVAYRLGKFGEKISYDTEKEKTHNSFLVAKKQFIISMINRTGQIKKAELVSIAHQFTDNEDWVNRLISIPIYSITKEAVDDLEDEIKKSYDRLSELATRTPQGEFRKLLKKI